jgi:hypothetical protein
VISAGADAAGRCTATPGWPDAARRRHSRRCCNRALRDASSGLAETTESVNDLTGHARGALSRCARRAGSYAPCAMPKGIESMLAGKSVRYCLRLVRRKAILATCA